MIEPLFPLPLSFGIASVVLAVLVFLEFRRKQKFLALRIAAQIFLVGSVLLMTLRPAIVKTNGSPILLLTEGYQQKTVDSLSSLTPVRVSMNQLAKTPGITAIAGNGLPSWALELLPSTRYTFIPPAAPKGITDIEFDDHIYAHRWNEIRGVYNGDEGSIKLRGPGGIDDSVKISRGPFSLSFFAKAPGRFNYDLITSEGTETLPLAIEPEKTLDIIFVSDYPTFELRYLKNFLASKGHRLSIRNQVSKGLYKFEFANRPATSFPSLTTALLNETDLVVIDQRSWQALGSNEQKNVRSAIENGLGIILIPEDSQSKLVHFKKTDDKDTVRITINRSTSERLPALSLTAEQSVAILRSGDRVVSGYSYSGAGKIGFQLLYETYQLGLQGKADAYTTLWVPLLEKCSRTAKNDLKLKITSPFPYYENEPISFDIISSGKQPKLKIDNIEYPLTEDVFIDDLWHGTAWLDGNSWHDFEMDSVSTSVHVAKHGTWKAVSATNNRNATTAKAGQQTGTHVAATTKDDSKLKIVLFSIFILAAGFLWLAPKL